jgi:alpha-amylase
MSSLSKHFIFCVHAHQPVGNFGNVFEESYEKCYRPFFEVAEKHPKFKLVSHFSGSLLDWLEARRPQFIRKVRSLAQKGQIEILGGAYYEPIYGVISQNDLAGQIDMMQRKIKALFGQRPDGAWLTERVWDPDLVRPLEKAGVKYTILDDTHFEKAKRPLPVTGYYRARRGRGALDLFASQKELRYMVPFRETEESLVYIRSLEAGPRDVIVLADDCEKFGFWPGTYDWVYGHGWLDQWMTMMENEPMLKLETFRGFRKLFGPVDCVRVPHASYSEMMEWSGGSFYNFFDKYPESGYMKERMSDVSEKLARSNGAHAPELKSQAQSALYRAQCNCSYWHGVFGGLYLHHLRSAVFENLIRADGWLNEKKEPVLFTLKRFETGKHWMLRQKNIISYFNPSYGAAMEELDYLPLPTNLTCTMQRRPEPYHALASKNNGGPDSPALLSIHEILGSKVKDLKQAICYDPFRRLSFLDHFFDKMIAWEAFHRSSYKEIGDFTEAKYRGALGHGNSKDTLIFERCGVIRQGSHRIPLSFKKVVRPVSDSSLEVRYTLKNLSRTTANFVFGIEFNFSIGAKESDKTLEVKNVNQRTFEDVWQGLEIHLETDRASTLLAAPVETISESESGLEKTYQQLAVLFQKDWKLKRGESKEQTICLEVGERL